jgi:hypothetical protein
MRAAAFLGVIATASLSATARDLVSIPVPDHAPLYVDRATLQRSGSVISANYLLDISSVENGKLAPGVVHSNEVEIAIDCVANTYETGRVFVYSEPQGKGPVAKAVPPPTVPQQRRITAPSTFSHLAEFLCRSGT